MEVKKYWLQTDKRVRQDNTDAKAEETGGQEPEKITFTKEIKFNNVSYRYPNTDKFILKIWTLHLRQIPPLV